MQECVPCGSTVTTAVLASCSSPGERCLPTSSTFRSRKSRLPSYRRASPSYRSYEHSVKTDRYEHRRPYTRRSSGQARRSSMNRLARKWVVQHESLQRIAGEVKIHLATRKPRRGERAVQNWLSIPP